MLGGYHEFDGTIEFYGRISSILRPSDTVLDLGAGRGAWYFEERCETRRRLRDLKPQVARLIGCDVDPVVLGNPTTSENLLISDGNLPVADASIDVIVADFVLEHIPDPVRFAREIDRVLKPGGYLCARTPHKYHYIAFAARLVSNRKHAGVLGHAQPERKAEDVFPTAYRLNTLGDIGTTFEGYRSYSYLYAGEPTYFFGSKLGYRLFSGLHKLLPRVLISNIFIFLQKPAR